MKIRGVTKFAKRMSQDIKELGFVEIPEVDIQADGGPMYEILVRSRRNSSHF